MYIKRLARGSRWGQERALGSRWGQERAWGNSWWQQRARGSRWGQERARGSRWGQKRTRGSRWAENLVQKALLVFESFESFEVYCRSIATPRLADTGNGDSPTRRYGESATPRLTDTESQRLPDSPMRGVWEFTKVKMKSLDHYVCLLLQASLVQQKKF
jgi:hypothetical protein